MCHLKRGFFMKENLSLIGAIAILIITIVNLTTRSELITGIIGGVLFVFVLTLNIISRKSKNKQK